MRLDKTPCFLFFDIDGTIAGADNDISPRLLQNLATLRQNNHKLFLCTGRTLCDVPEPMLLLFDGIIAGAGAHIVAEGQELHRFTLPLPLLHTVIGHIYSRGYSSMMEGVHQLWRIMGKTPLPWPFPVLQKGQLPTADMQVQKFTVHFPTAEDYEAFAPLLPRELLHYPNQTRTFLEAVHHTQTKATAMHRLLAHYNAGAANAIAFGDSLNDYDILQAAGTGVAMGNAPNRVKQIATLVTGTLKEDGVCTALHTLGLV